MKQIERYRAILASERLVLEIVRDELVEMKNKYGDERRTEIIAAEGEIETEDLIKEETTVVALTHYGYIKRMPVDTYRAQRRGGKGITYGRNATKEGMHYYMDVEHYENTKVKNLNISGMKIEKYNEVFIAYIEEV